MLTKSCKRDNQEFSARPRRKRQQDREDSEHLSSGDDLDAAARLAMPVVTRVACANVSNLPNGLSLVGAGGFITDSNALANRHMAELIAPLRSTRIRIHIGNARSVVAVGRQAPSRMRAKLLPTHLRAPERCFRNLGAPPRLQVSTAPPHPVLPTTERRERGLGNRVSINPSTGGSHGGSHSQERLVTAAG